MGHAGRIAAGLLALAMLGRPAGADQPKQDERVDRKAIDTALFDTLRDVINKGADMYNNGDMTGCYRLFEGALMTAKPMLAHRPDLQKVIGRALASADRDPITFRRAFALRASLDKVRAELNPKKEAKLPAPIPDQKTEDKKPTTEDKKPVPEADKPKDKKPAQEDKKSAPEADKPKPEEKKPKQETKNPAPEVKKTVEKKSTTNEKKDDESKEYEKLPLPKSEPGND